MWSSSHNSCFKKYLTWALGHADFSTILSKSDGSIKDAVFRDNDIIGPPCKNYIPAKMTRCNIPKLPLIHIRGLYFLDVLLTDVFCPIQSTSSEGAHYLATFINKASRSVGVFPIKAKSDHFMTFKHYWAAFERRTELLLKMLLSDGEGNVSEFKSLFYSHGTENIIPNMLTLQQQRIAEDMNQTLINAQYEPNAKRDSMRCNC